MKSIKSFTKQSLHNLGAAATKRIIKQFANKHHMVYFGHVDPREDEYELVRGLTLSTSHVDNHYTVGEYQSRDIILVERRNTLTFPNKPAASYRWLIAQIDLRRGGLPHIFIDCNHHDATFYANAFLSRQGMQDLSSYFGGVSHSFAQKAKLFANPSDYTAVGTLITPEVGETIAQHFAQFDYECFDDRLLIYTSNLLPSPVLLEEMLRVGTWLASVCENAAI
ncbi:MAG TPA: hypothetical protein VM581_04050 [Magnetospirillaceae bacterium]|nr:hypothetical protein [Magnetospirillaceae bacterium]